jgi:TonB-linked SusC/RagA family outer membrane protein
MKCKKNNIKYVCLLIAILNFSPTFSQSAYQLSGWVKGIDNQAVENVTISVLGSSNKPAVSDEEGKYEIEVESGGVWVSFQPIEGLESKTVFLDDRMVLNVYLAEEGFSTYNDYVLGEGMHQQSKDVITAHQSITSEQMKYSNNITVDQFFQTHITGAYVINSSGMPGAGTSTFLRGINSLNTGNQPLYVVDGIPLERSSYYQSLSDGFNYNPITSLDPLDISYITVYKDPSYTSKYGLYGANGVVEIKTINPDASKTTIDLKYRTGIDLSPDYLPQLESAQYKVLANEILYSTGAPNEDYTKDFPGLYYTPNDTENYGPYSHNTNWQDEVFQDAMMQNVHFSIKGGDAIAKYGISFGYLNKEGLIKNTSYDRFNARFAGTFNIIERIKMFLNVNMVNSHMNLRESALNSPKSPILSGLWKSPILSPYAYDDLGNKVHITADLDELGVSNPLALSEGFTGNNSNIRFSTSAKIIGELTSNIDIVAMFAVNYNTMSESAFSPNTGMGAYQNGELYNEVSEYYNTYSNLYSNLYANYSNAFGNNDVHRVSGILGMKLSNVNFQNDYALTGNTPSDDYTSLGSGQNIYNSMGGNNINYGWLSLNAGLNYNYKTKYFLDFNLSSDASTAIGQEASTPLNLGDVPMSLFYSIGGAWRISDEFFLKNNSLFEDVKVRASYGTAGNDNFSVLASKTYNRTDHFHVLGVSVPGALANPALNYETKVMLNTGLDLVIKGGRHQVIFDWYNSTVNDMLVYNQLPSYMGESVFPSNAGKVNTQGIEFSLNTRVIDYKDLKIDLGLKLGKYRTEVLAMPNDKLVSNLPGMGEIVSQVGGELYSFYGYEYEGVFATTEESSVANLTNKKGYSYSQGDAKFKDRSGAQGIPDGVIDDHDKVELGSPNPDLVGVLSARITYKNWSLSAMSTFAKGQEIFNYLRYQNEKMTDLSNQSIKVLQRWTTEGQQTDIPRATAGDPIGNSDFSSRWIEDGSYLRIKELTLSYRLPKSVWIVRNLETFISVNNLATFTNYVGYDPEMSYSYNPSLQGIDYGMMPQPRSFTFGVNIGL